MSALEAFRDHLLRHGLADEAALERAGRLSEAGGEPLHYVLAKLGLVPERDLAAALAQVTGLPLAACYPDAPVMEASPKFLRDVLAVPLAEAEGALVVAVADPLDSYPAAALAQAAGRPVRLAVGLPSDIEAAIARLYGHGVGPAPPEGECDDEDVARLRDLAAEAPVIRLVNGLIAHAVEARASDIHIEPGEVELGVRLRIDGILRPADSPPRRLHAAMVSRIKIMARLNIAERRLPQDGRIKLSVRGADVDLRVSTLPAIHGESVVMRILDRGARPLELESLGFAGPPLDRVLDLLGRPNGVMLVTGPTGSGKTTTLYAALRRISGGDSKIITVEDPVEYQIPGITQIQVQPRIGLDFAQVLRSILRHDPDVVMIGEIRDLETAEIAVQSALTGHLVLSTLHTNSAAATITRLLDMGVAGYLITSAVNGIVAQRLVRRLCPHCRQPYAPLPDLVVQTGLERLSPHPRLYRAGGCGSCGGTGYAGRTTVFEVLPLDEDIRRLVLARAAAADIQRAAIERGMRSMMEDGLRKALEGVTTLDEVLRVTREA